MPLQDAGWRELGERLVGALGRLLLSLLLLLFRELLSIKLQPVNRVVNQLTNVVGVQNFSVAQSSLQTGESLVDVFELRVVDCEQVMPAMVVSKFVSASATET